MISYPRDFLRAIVRPAAHLLVAACAAFALFGGEAAAVDDPLATWIGTLRSCTGKRAPRIAVAGFERTETAVSREEAEDLRLEVEERLQKAGLALTSAADVTRLKALRESTTRLPAADAEAQIHAAFDGDAVIFFVAPNRQTGHVRFRLQAITGAADCKATSEQLELALTGTSGLADVGQVMANAVRRLVEAAPRVRFVDILPFSARAGHSICSDALTDALAVAFAAEAQSPARLLNGTVLSAARVTAPAPPEAGRVSAHGTFELDSDNRPFISLEFTGDGGATLAPTGRVAVAIERLGCDPTIRPFLDHVEASARTDRTRLDLSAPVFARGQRLEVVINPARAMSLYCWVVAPDGSGYAALPADGRPAAVKASRLRYPRDFGLEDILLGDEAFQNLFACFGLERELPSRLDQLWREHAPGAAAEAKLIDPAALALMLSDFRALPGIVEATARIVVR